MKTSIAFACLTYTYQGVSDNAFPYASAIVASYAKKLLHDKIEIELFKYPNDFKDYLEKKNQKLYVSQTTLGRLISHMNFQKE